MEYSEFVASRTRDSSDIVKELNADKTHLIHMAMGIAGEAGELLDAIKKHTMYGQSLNYANVAEELGDIEFYMQGLRNALQISRNTIINQNVAKLSVRYKKEFTKSEAEERNDKS